METTTPAQDPSSQAGATSADRLRIVSTPGTRGGKLRIDGYRITVPDITI
jgi:uncharacterized protein (DUF433 family)